MTVTMEQVRNALLPEEPDYRAAAELGPEALPLLRELVDGDDAELATKAASLAGLIDHPDSVSVLEAAVGSAHASTRVAAAFATKHLSAERAGPVLARLLADDDAGVRKMAITSIPEEATAELRAALAQVVETDAHEPLRILAQETTTRLAP